MRLPNASVVVPVEDGPDLGEDDWGERAGDPKFAQVLLLTRAAEPLGQRRYWPIYEAAEAANLPIGIHAFGYGGSAMTSGGWPSFYIEEMVGHAQCQQAVLTSLIFEGVFATDYPHWDYDDPSHALPIKMTEQQKRGIFLENARAVYGFA